jgi:hypothetical protein
MEKNANRCLVLSYYCQIKITSNALTIDSKFYGNGKI